MNQMDGKGQLVTGLPVHRCHRCVIRLVDDLYIFFYRRCRIIYFSLTLVHAYRWISASVSLAVGGRPIHRIPFFFKEQWNYSHSLTMYYYLPMVWIYVCTVYAFVINKLK